MKNQIVGTPFWLKCPGQKNERKMMFFEPDKKEQEDYKYICPPSAKPINFSYHLTSLSTVVVKTLCIKKDINIMNTRIILGQ